MLSSNPLQYTIEKSNAVFAIGLNVCAQLHSSHAASEANLKWKALRARYTTVVQPCYLCVGTDKSERNTTQKVT